MSYERDSRSEHRKRQSESERKRVSWVREYIIATALDSERHKFLGLSLSVRHFGVRFGAQWCKIIKNKINI